MPLIESDFEAFHALLAREEQCLAAIDLTGWPQSAMPVVVRTMVIGPMPVVRFVPAGAGWRATFEIYGDEN